MNKIAKSLLILGLIFFIYGNLCRVFGVYFFWESKSIGWFLILSGLIGFILNLPEIKTTNRNKKLLFKTITIGVSVYLVGILMAELKSVIAVTVSHGYNNGIILLEKDESLKSEIGEIKSFGLLPTATRNPYSFNVFSTTSIYGENDEGYSNLLIDLTIKGTRKYKDISIHVYKDDQEWKMERAN